MKPDLAKKRRAVRPVVWGFLTAQSRSGNTSGAAALSAPRGKLLVSPQDRGIRPTHGQDGQKTASFRLTHAGSANPINRNPIDTCRFDPHIEALQRPVSECSLGSLASAVSTELQKVRATDRATATINGGILPIRRRRTGPGQLLVKRKRPTQTWPLQEERHHRMIPLGRPATGFSGA
jgi:hypothetical protein